MLKRLHAAGNPICDILKVVEIENLEFLNLSNTELNVSVGYFS